MPPNDDSPPAATLTDRYRLERQIGKGGMATVYLAEDLKHRRRVALKILHAELSAALGPERFLKEIELTASLQHPHILPLFDSGNADGQLFYVMPFVEGESLRDRLTRESQLPIDDTIRIVREVADALQYAHEHGVIHRDIKPENILLHGGHALVADFGIALAVQQASGTRITQTGFSLGTPQYMAPEQAMGERIIDARADVFALGSVTYEMLVGQPPFTGPSAQAIMARMMNVAPAPLRSTRISVPPVLEHAVLKALEKIPADRHSSAREFASALQERAPATGSSPPPPAAVPARPWLRDPRSIAALAALATLMAIASFTAMQSSAREDGPSTAGTLRFDLTPSIDAPLDLSAGVPVTISADGRVIVYVAVSGGTRVLVSRRIDELESHVIPGTQGAAAPALSPDGRWVAFFRTSKISKVPLDGGAVMHVADVPTVDYRGRMSWLDDDEIVYASPVSGRVVLSRVPVTGGASAPFTFPDSAAPGERHGFPVFVKAHGLVLYASLPAAGATGARIGVTRVSDGRSSIVRVPGVNPLGLALGHLIYLTVDGTVMAVPFDVSALQATGEPATLLRAGRQDAVALSPSGTLVYVRGTTEGQLMKVDERGRGTPLVPTRAQMAHPRFSPDGRRLAVDIATGSGGLDVWTFDVASGTPTRLTTTGLADRPEWTSDGSRLVYLAAPHPAELIERVWSQPADGGAPAQEIFRSQRPIREVILADQGRRIIFREDSPTTERDIYMASLEPKGEATPVAVTPADELMPQLSPDGRWLAYQSNESGRYEIYVRAFPGAGSRTTVSIEGGTEPVWSRDGARLFYRNGTEMVAASIAGGGAFGVTSRTVLFRGPFDLHAFHPNYDVMPDGRHFVMVSSGESENRIVVVANWFQELQRRFEGLQQAPGR